MTSRRPAPPPPAGTVGGYLSQPSGPGSSMGGLPQYDDYPSPSPLATANGAAGAGDVSFEARLNVTGESNITILRSKIDDLRNEVSRQKKDLREAHDKIAELVDVLNEQKLQNTQLVNKGSSIMNKLTTTEESEKQLEDALLLERKNHQATRDALEQTREKLRQLSSRKAENESRSNSPQHAQAASNTAKDLLELEERHRAYIDQLRLDVAESLSRLSASKEDDDTAVFVARSAALSCASELDAKLNRLDSQLQLIADEVTQNIREQEDETAKMVLSLMEENKDLWARLSQYQFEVDKARTELSMKARGLQGPGKEHVQQLNEQIEALEGMLKKSQVTIAEQTNKAREHEEKMRDLLNDFNQLQQRYQSLDEERGVLANEVSRYENSLQEAYKQRSESEAQALEVQRLNFHLSGQIRLLNEQLKNAEETKLLELRNQLRATQNERDDANAAASRFKSELDDSLVRIQTLTRELEVRTEKFNTYKIQSDEHNAQLARQAQAEIAGQRESFERALNDARQELATKTQEVYDMLRDLEEERRGRNTLKTELRGKDDEVAMLRNELSSLQAQRQRLEEKYRAVQAELEQLKTDYHIGSSKKRDIDSELTKAQSDVATLQGMIEEERRRHTVSVESIELQWKEVDTRRQELEEDVRALRLQLSEMESTKAANTRMERDKAQLMHENARLLSQYEEVLRHNNDAQAMIARLKSRDNNGPKNQATVEELQRRLSELPSIRQQLDESKRESYRLREEISALVREKNELESRLAHYAEETRRTLRKDAEFERVVREASSQVKRLDQQIDESAIVVNRRGAEPLLTTTRGGGEVGAGRNGVSTPQTQRNYY